jgi:hypothetical protein
MTPTRKRASEGYAAIHPRLPSGSCDEATPTRAASVHRIFPFLLLLAAGFLAAAMALGFLVEPKVPGAGIRWYTLHFYLAVTASLVVMLVNAIVLTYFIGTSRWCREVTDAYALPPDSAGQSNRLKRRTFPFTLANMLVVVGLAALGAAADTNTSKLPGISWGQLHLAGVIAGLAFMAWASNVQWSHIRANQQVIRNILDQVRSIRAAKGLDQARVEGASASQASVEV